MSSISNMQDTRSEMQQNFVLCMKRNSENYIANWNFMPFA